MYFSKYISSILDFSSKKIIQIKYRYCQSIKIGNVTKTITVPKNPHLVPTGYLPKNPSQSLLRHLQWIMKKDILGQDLFLIGMPGPYRSLVILQYLELTQREVEYVVLSRDTTENDLKQRREILNGTAHYVDQAAVRAAIEGRFLILDGVEKVERNVLPVLNNLLENREMQLEDGRFLIAPQRYDNLIEEHSNEKLQHWKLVRISENFRVVALGLPVPLFKGNPLDPPFRSRFQARNVQLSFEDNLSELSNISIKLPEKLVKNFVSACYSFQSNESASLGMPKFPVDHIHNVLSILSRMPNIPLHSLFHWVYPYNLVLSKDGQTSVLSTLKNFSISPQDKNSNYTIILSPLEVDKNLTHCIKFDSKNICHVLGHKDNHYKDDYGQDFVQNEYHDSILSDMLRTHSQHDFCLVGNKGSGKSVLVRKFASILNYPIEVVMLYTDMTARDLLQQRITDEKGNTMWRSSQLVNAAKEGKLLVLDGLHRLHSSTLFVLQRLIHNREMQLFDGTRLLSHKSFETIKKENNFSDSDMNEKKIVKIHPAFRIIALGETPKVEISKDQWITPELMSMFLFHSLRPLSLEEEKFVIKKLIGQESEKINVVLDFAHRLRDSEDETLKNVSASFSTRQLVRLSQRLTTFPDVCVYSLITQTCLHKFLPQLTKQALENVLESCNIKYSNLHGKQKEIRIEGDKLYIGETSVSIYKPGERKVKVPNVLFYNNQEHLEIMEAMLQDFVLGEHLLLVGNQGVGKNKITDRFLQLLNRPREYIQLHRDTTVQSLTQQPTVIDGKIVYEDSPLLKAVQQGNVLIVDEADKAPTHVTSILKALVESGEMVLSDGRSIVHQSDVSARNEPSKVVMHPDFRMIVLANRPGFPFLGNDFFATLGDIFSCHAVDNPSLESEIAMLHQYAPNVPENILKKLTKLFGDLRSMSDAGLISYPYSTREVVNITKHIGKFPEESLSHVLKNVFDFDSHSYDLKDTLQNLFRKHGIPFQGETIALNTATFYNLPMLTYKSKWNFEKDFVVWNTKASTFEIEDDHTWPLKVKRLDFTETRGSEFSEQLNYCSIPIKSNDIPLDIDAAQSEDEKIFYVASANPVSLHRISEDSLEIKTLILSSYFPTIKSGFKPNVKISALFSGLVFFHEISTNKFFLIQPTKGLVKRLNLESILEDTISRITNAVYARSHPKAFYSCFDFPSKKKILITKFNTDKLCLLNFETNQTHIVYAPENIRNISIFDENTLLFISENGNFIADITDPLNWQVRKFISDNSMPLDSSINLKINKINNHWLSKESIVPQDLAKTIILQSEDYATILTGTISSDAQVNLYGFKRKYSLDVKERQSCILPNSIQAIRLVNSRDLPAEVKGNFSDRHSGYIEVINLNDLTYGYISVDMPHVSSSYASWLANTSESYLQICALPNEEILTIDLSGCVRKWQTNKVQLKSSFDQWQNMLGLNNEERLSLEYSNKNAAESPKHGKVDPTGNPHVGGNTWAGGTGGRDTAGLGGKGGPYRLDAGHTVYQLPDSEKEAVPKEVKEAARKMALKAYKDKLREINMSEYDAELYGKFLENVKKQINILRVILESLQAKGKERRWMKHQTSGEMDDTKLIESITGEKSIYKKRGEQEPEMGSPQEKPKLLRLVVDVSGSMYRFNGHDNRLQRELESIVLVVEAFDGYDAKFKYEIVGHSGEEFNEEFSSFSSPPKNDKEKLDIIKKMYAHSQFCASGDNTLLATQHAIKSITDEEADEYFVIVLSDANFDRYGISPKEFSNILVSNPKVNAFAIFIGSLGNQANLLLKQMPAGRAFVCFDSADITHILQKIFTSALLKD